MDRSPFPYASDNPAHSVVHTVVFIAESSSHYFRIMVGVRVQI